jgi:AcrR family transcriptional regulator
MHLRKLTEINQRPNSKNIKSRGGLAKRNKILSTAGSLFAEKGYRETSVEDIAKSAKVNKATIYYYSHSKANLLFEVAMTAMDALMDLAKPVIDSSLTPEKKLMVLVTNHIKWQTSHRRFAGIGQIERRNLTPKLLGLYTSKRDEYEVVFRKLISEVLTKEEAQHMSPKLATLLILGLVNSIITWYKPNGECSIEEITKAVNLIILRALNLPPPA